MRKAALYTALVMPLGMYAPCPRIGCASTITGVILQLSHMQLSHKQVWHSLQCISLTFLDKQDEVSSIAILVAGGKLLVILLPSRHDERKCVTARFCVKAWASSNIHM